MIGLEAVMAFLLLPGFLYELLLLVFFVLKMIQSGIL